MNPNLIISIALVAAIGATFACVLAHRWAKRRHWTYIPRYVAGALIVLIGFGFPLFIGMPTGDALPLFMSLLLVYAGGAIGTFLAYDSDPDPPGTPEADELIRRLDEELRK